MKTAIQELPEQRRLLQMEYDEEKAAFAQTTMRVGISRLEARG